jgi:hypothetical protein
MERLRPQLNSIHCWFFIIIISIFKYNISNYICETAGRCQGENR